MAAVLLARCVCRRRSPDEPAGFFESEGCGRQPFSRMITTSWKSVFQRSPKSPVALGVEAAKEKLACERALKGKLEIANAKLVGEIEAAHQRTLSYILETEAINAKID